MASRRFLRKTAQSPMFEVFNYMTLPDAARGTWSDVKSVIAGTWKTGTQIVFCLHCLISKPQATTWFRIRETFSTSKHVLHLCIHICIYIYICVCQNTDYHIFQRFQHCLMCPNRQSGDCILSAVVFLFWGADSFLGWVQGRDEMAEKSPACANDEWLAGDVSSWICEIFCAGVDS